MQTKKITSNLAKVGQYPSLTTTHPPPQNDSSADPPKLAPIASNLKKFNKFTFTKKQKKTNNPEGRSAGRGHDDSWRVALSDPGGKSVLNRNPPLSLPGKIDQSSMKR